MELRLALITIIDSTRYFSSASPSARKSFQNIFSLSDALSFFELIRVATVLAWRAPKKLNHNCCEERPALRVIKGIQYAASSAGSLAATRPPFFRLPSRGSSAARRGAVAGRGGSRP